jgi:hypothetical protein
MKKCGKKGGICVMCGYREKVKSYIHNMNVY